LDFYVVALEDVVVTHAGQCATTGIQSIGEQFARIFSKHGVPLDVAKENGNRVSTKRAAVRLLTMHSAKGLEFPCVAVGGLGAVGRHGEAIEDGIRLTYVAITRATHEAFLTCSRVTPLIERLTG
jgi:ATP-dependent exoDNAse (exonuclease V) beta subunit